MRPKLKKVNMDLIKKNYRPVSNLALLSKITEKAAALQISDHVSFNQMFSEFQSAYRKYHSTETALLRMRNDILVSMNKQQVTLLVFLDLSAAFDTVDHDILLRRLEYKFGIKDQAVTWFKSYLSNRSHLIVIGSAKSDSFDLKFGVPQGSCLDPMLFSLYTSDLFDVTSQHLPTAHSYADDASIYLAFNPNDDSDRDVLRFLWVDAIAKPSPEIVVLRFTRVVFGVSSSPFLLNATVKHHIERYKEADPEFVEKFLRSIYVDDLQEPLRLIQAMNFI